MNTKEKPLVNKKVISKRVVSRVYLYIGLILGIELAISLLLMIVKQVNSMIYSITPQNSEPPQQVQVGCPIKITPLPTLPTPSLQTDAN